MDAYPKNWTISETQVFDHLCLKAGEKLSQREIAKILKISPTAAGTAVRELTDQRMLKIEKMKTINLVSFNRENQAAVNLKRVENLKNIYTSGLLNYLEEHLAGATIILFGSYSRGEDTQNSDIDLAVIERKNKVLALEKYDKSLNRRININFYKSWGDIQKNLKNNILNGILLHGSVEA